MKRAVKIVLMLSAAALVVGLAGCATAAQTAGAAGSSSQGVASTTTPSPSLSPRDRCNPNQGQYTTDDPSFKDMRDLGPREFATGTATFNKEGRPAAYTVAPGDVDIAITQRFCITIEELYGTLNSVRFCHENRQVLQPGDVLNLDPATVDSVGKHSGTCG
ncbi:MAG: hypothetical protein J0J05_11265 [Microbacterium sp.]|uniref:hypothetical protein n=1 Tax=Bacteria TaxID=2 RepID=UPI001ACFE592|nr:MULTISPECIES: hypothetical protein [Bacteria]MBN9154552.1 hypothetical protein [Microbacterium sp.]